MPIHMSACMSVCISIRMSARRSIRMSIHMPIHMSVHACLYTCLYTHIYPHRGLLCSCVQMHAHTPCLHACPEKSPARVSARMSARVHAAACSCACPYTWPRTRVEAHGPCPPPPPRTGTDEGTRECLRATSAGMARCSETMGGRRACVCGSRKGEKTSSCGSPARTRCLATTCAGEADRHEPTLGENWRGRTQRSRGAMCATQRCCRRRNTADTDA